jgi:hypothetical protein
VLDYVTAVLAQPILTPRDQLGGAGRSAARVVDRVHDEVIARCPVQRCHVERGRGGPLLDEAADLEAVGIRTAMHDLMNCPGESMEPEDHVDRVGEELAKLDFVHAVRMIFRPDQRHEVDDVDDSSTQLRQTIVQDLGRRDDFHRHNVSGAGQHDVRLLTAVVVLRPLPNSCATRAVLNSLIHSEPLQLRLLVDHNQVHIRR